MNHPMPHEAADDRASALTAFALGELEGADAARVEAWLEEDAEARLEAGLVRALGTRLTEEFAAEDAPGLTEQQKAAVRAAFGPAPGKVVRPLRWVGTLCALGVAAALTVFAGVMLVQEFRAPKLMTGLTQRTAEEAPSEERIDSVLEGMVPEPSVAMRGAPPPGAPAASASAAPDELESARAAGDRAQRAAVESAADMAMADAAADSAEELALSPPPDQVAAGAAALAMATSDDKADIPTKPVARLARRAMRKTAASETQAQEPATIFAYPETEQDPMWPVLQTTFLLPLWTSTASFDFLRERLNAGRSFGGEPQREAKSLAGDFVAALAQAAGPVSEESPAIRLRSALAPETGATWLVSVSAGVSGEATPEAIELFLEIDPERIVSVQFVGYGSVAEDLEDGGVPQRATLLKPGVWSGLLCELAPRPGAVGGESQTASGRPWLTVRLLRPDEEATEEVGTAALLTELPVPWEAADPVLRAQTAGAAFGLALETESALSAEQLARWKAWVPGTGGGAIFGDFRAILDAAAGEENGD